MKAKDLVSQVVKPMFKALNFSRLDGVNTNQAALAFDEALTKPFGDGARVVVLQNSPFCERCLASFATL